MNKKFLLWERRMQEKVPFWVRYGIALIKRKYIQNLL